MTRLTDIGKVEKKLLDFYDFKLEETIFQFQGRHKVIHQSLKPMKTEKIGKYPKEIISVLENNLDKSKLEYKLVRKDWIRKVKKSNKSMFCLPEFYGILPLLLTFLYALPYTIEANNFEFFTQSMVVSSVLSSPFFYFAFKKPKGSNGEYKEVEKLLKAASKYDTKLIKASES